MIKETLVLKPEVWEKLKARIIEDYGLSMIALRSKCRKTLGFKFRHHEEWSKPSDRSKWRLVDTVRLDIYDQGQVLMFMMKYSDIIKHEEIRKLET